MKRFYAELFQIVLAILTCLLLLSPTARASLTVYQWEYDAGGNKVESAVQCPGSGQPSPTSYGADSPYCLDGLDFTKGYFANRVLFDSSTGNGYTFNHCNLTEIYAKDAVFGPTDFENAVLTKADLRGATLCGCMPGSEDLYSCNLMCTTLTGADLSNAVISGDSWIFSNALIAGANFSSTAFNRDQLYATASYGTYQYLDGLKLIEHDLSGWDFSNQSIMGVDFHGANMSGTILNGATIRQANFSSATGLTFAQFSASESYQSRNLKGIRLEHDGLSNWSFAGQNLQDAGFYGATLGGVDFTGAILINVDLRCSTLGGGSMTSNALAALSGGAVPLADAQLSGAVFDDADLSGADLRGATDADLTAAASTRNAILPDGDVDGLQLAAGETFVVRNYDSGIHVAGLVSIDPAATVKMVLDDSAWNSTISFDAGDQVTLRGNLKLTFAADVDTAGLVGSSFQLFDWTGIDVSGEFAIVSDYNWDVSDLNTTGRITLKPAPEPGTAVLLTAVLFAAAIGIILPSAGGIDSTKSPSTPT